MAEESYHITIEKDPESEWLVVQCIEHPEAVTQGKSIDECLKNIREALDLVIEHKKGTKKPKLILEVPAALA